MLHPVFCGTAGRQPEVQRKSGGKPCMPPLSLILIQPPGLEPLPERVLIPVRVDVVIVQVGFAARAGAFANVFI